MKYTNDSNLGHEIRAITGLPVKKLAVHVAVWAAYMSYEQLSLYIVNERLGNLSDFFYFYSCNISLFYCHAFLLKKCFSHNSRLYTPAILGILLELIIFLALKGIWEYYFALPPVGKAENIHIFSKVLTLDLVRNFYYIAFATVYWAVRDTADSRKRTADMEIEKLELGRNHAELAITLANTQNAHLRQQLNPHLLFNTLSFIYNSVYRNSAPAGKAVLLLSDIMRFSYYPVAADGRVFLTDEIEQIQNLIQINHYRFSYAVLLDFTIEGDTGELRIIPLILLTLAENMFKHGVFEQTPGKIAIYITGTQLRFNTMNKNQNNGRSDPGIGLHNTRLRLDHAYRDRHHLEVLENEGFYNLNLTVEL